MESQLEAFQVELRMMCTHEKIIAALHRHIERKRENMQRIQHQLSMHRISYGMQRFDCVKDDGMDERQWRQLHNQLMRQYKREERHLNELKTQLQRTEQAGVLHCPVCRTAVIGEDLEQLSNELDTHAIGLILAHSYREDLQGLEVVGLDIF